MKNSNIRILSYSIVALLASGVRAGESSAAPSPAGVTLQECFDRARKINESVGISAEYTRLIQHQVRAKQGAVLPSLHWIKEQFYQEKGGVPGGGSPLQTQPLSFFEANQPIFGGFRDWAAIDIAKSQAEQAKLNERSTDLQLLSDVAEAFYAAYTLQDTLSVLQETRKLNQDQVDQLERWVNIGRSRPSEALSAQTQLATLDAQIASTKRSITEARHLLFFLTGVDETSVLRDDAPLTGAATLDDVLGRAGKRPELLSAAESLRQAELGIRFAKGSHYPTLGASGRYYTERVGFLTDVRWDATVRLDVPLYEGGSTQAAVRAARSQEIIARLTLARARRDVERQVRTAYDNLSQSTTEADAYDKAVQLALKNYETQQKEYRLGIINNLELLQLLTNTQQVRRQWLNARANARLDQIRLRVATGEGL